MRDGRAYPLASRMVNLERPRHPRSGREAIRATGLGCPPSPRDRRPRRPSAMNDVTRILSAIEHGDPQAAEQLLPLVYDELRKLAAQQARPREARPDPPGDGPGPRGLPPARRDADEPGWNSRGHFFAAAAEAMRRILVENARRKAGPKGRRGPRARRPRSRSSSPSSDPRVDLLALDEALDGAGRPSDPRKADLVKLRFFAGLTVEQAAQASGSPPQRPTTHWAYAKGWLRLAMRGDERSSAAADRENLLRDRWRIRAPTLALGYRGRADRQPRSGPMNTDANSTKRRSSTWPVGSAIPEERDAYLDEACGGDAALLGRLERCCSVSSRRRASSSPRPRRHGRRAARTPRRTRPLDRAPRHRHRPVQAAGADRRGGHGRRLHGRADHARPPQGRAEDHQAGHGLAAGDRPVRGRAAGAGHDGPPQHRPRPRRRRHRVGPPLLRHGAGQGRPDHRLLRRRAPEPRRPARPVRAGLPGGAARATRRGSSTGTSSRRTS